MYLEMSLTFAILTDMLTCNRHHKMCQITTLHQLRQGDTWLIMLRCVENEGEIFDCSLWLGQLNYHLILVGMWHTLANQLVKCVFSAWKEEDSVYP